MIPWRLKKILKTIITPEIQAVSIEPTNDCNSDCNYCHRKMRPVGYMNMSHFKRLIAQLPANIPVTLSYGGESIIHPQFVEMSRYASERGHRVTVYSNGLESYPDYVETVVYAKPPPIILTWDQRFQDPNNLKPVYKTCSEPYYGINILWNGDVVPCCHDVAGKRVMGNVFNSSIRGVWAGKAFRALRKRGHCEGCEIYKYDLSAKSVEDFARLTDPSYQINAGRATG
jgi:MoaA/NifB/PqqE/SkfB family radical SAM enzyme